MEALTIQPGNGICHNPWIPPKPLVLEGHAGAVAALAYQPKQHVLITAGPSDPPRLWDLSRSWYAEGPDIFETNMFDIQTCVVSPSREWIAFQGNGRNAWISNMDAFEPVAPAGEAKGLPVPKLPKSTHLMPLHAKDIQVRNLFFSPDGHWLAAAGWRSDFYLRKIDKEKGLGNWYRLKGHRSISENALFSPASNWMLTLDINHEARLWRLNDTAFQNTSYPISPMDQQASIQFQAFSPDDRWLLTATPSGKIGLWHLSSGKPGKKPFSMPQSAGALTGAGFSPDGKWLVTAHDDTWLHLWRMTSDDIAYVRPIGQQKTMVQTA